MESENDRKWWEIPAGDPVAQFVSLVFEDETVGEVVIEILERNSIDSFWDLIGISGCTKFHRMFYKRIQWQHYRKLCEELEILKMDNLNAWEAWKKKTGWVDTEDYRYMEEDSDDESVGYPDGD